MTDSMLQIDGEKIRALQGVGGVPFTRFVDALIRTDASVAGIPDSAIQTNIRTNLPDGGVDTTVRQADPNDPTGWLQAPTVWQYKATAFTNVESARDLLAGQYVIDRIKERYAFRLAIADSFPSAERDRRTEALRTVCLGINPAALDPLILTADDLAAWANRYLGFVLGWFFPSLMDTVLHLDVWGATITSATPRFVPVPTWDNVVARVKEHLDFGQIRPSVVETLQGESGVGKSRLVYEVLSGIPGMQALAVYCSDEDAAIRASRIVANLPPSTKAVLVADECSAEGREGLRRIVQGHASRIRVVAIDNSGQRPPSGEPELWLAKMPEASLEHILDVNYPAVPRERRRAYAELAEGYPRLAADLCSHDAAIMAAGGVVTPVIPSIRDYLRVRLNAEQQRALQALSLVTRVGNRREVAGEFEELCKLLMLDPAVNRDLLGQIHKGPGFAAQGPRYCYVTPEIVAQVAFDQAWRRWASEDPEGFLARIPEALLQRFLDRVQQSADEEVRRICGQYFRGWAARLRPEDLADEPTTARLVGLVDTDPAEYLPRLRRITEEATQETLLRITGQSSQGRWGPRRALVWLAERFARFPDFFDDCERILLRLAGAETEPDIGNNATGLWIQLFQVFLSGTATPFSHRLTRLRERLQDRNEGIRMLATRALGALFTSHASRMAGTPVVGGRIPPEEWNPRTNRQAAECFHAALMLVREGIGSGDPLVAAALLELISVQGRWFLLNGYLNVVRAILAEAPLTEANRVALIESLDTFLFYDAPRRPAEATAYVEQVRAWRDSLVGADLHSRLLAIVGRPRWGASRLRNESWQPSLEALAEELIHSPGALRAEIPWLFGRQAKAADELGVEVGRRDTDAVFFAEVAAQSLASKEWAFTRGYIRGLLGRFPEHAGRVNSWLDEHEADAALLVAEIAIAGGEGTRALERVLRLFDVGLLPPQALTPWNFASGADPFPADRFEALIGRLARSAAGGNAEALRVGVDALAFFVPKDEHLLSREGIREASWTLVELASAPGALRTDWWGEVLEALAHLDPARTARLASRMLVDDIERGHVAEQVLITLARQRPSTVMEAIGEVILNEERGWKFYILDYRSLISNLPDAVVIQWITQVGPEGARRLARHLPAPYLDGDTPVVPPLTEWVLKEFAEDDRVFREFYAGVHSFQMYSGDIARQHEAEAAIARAFRDHPLPRIRQWAEMEERGALEDAKRWREEMEERGFL